MISHLLKEKTILLVLFFLICSIPSFAFADAEKIFKENSKSVVVVATFDNQGNPLSQGSGFIIRSDGAIVTNYHVISNAEIIKVKAGEILLDVEGLIHVDKKNDIVILKARGEKLQVVNLGNIEEAHIGEKVYVISSPQGYENTISDGILSGIRKTYSEDKILQISAPISSGSSGSPVFNKKGEVIGIATFLIKGSQNLNFAMPVNLIKNSVTRSKIISLEKYTLKNHDTLAWYWLFMGIYYGADGKNKESTESFIQAIRINPDYEEAYFYIGLNYAAEGNYKEAIKAYKQAIGINPNYEEAYIRVSSSYVLSGQYHEATEALKQAIRINPDNVNAYLGLGDAFGMLKKYKKATEAFKQAIRINPDNVNAYLGLGFMYALLRKYEESKHAFVKATYLKHDSIEAHYQLGKLYIILNDKSSALDQYKILKYLDKEFADKLFNLIDS